MDRVKSAGWLVCAALAIWTTGPAIAQENTAEDEAASDVFFPDRDAIRRLTQATEALAAKKYNDAVQWLKLVLEQQEDRWSQPATKPDGAFRGVRADAYRLLESMPAEGRAAFEFLYGVQAQRNLAKATASGDLVLLEDVARQFPHTAAGYEAAWLLARNSLDAGDPTAAASRLERLQAVPEAAARFEPSLSVLLAIAWRSAEMPDRAQEALSSLRRKSPNVKLSLGGHEVQLFREDAQALGWLASNSNLKPAPPAKLIDDWQYFGGNPQRAATTSGGLPVLNPRWTVQANLDPRANEVLNDREAGYGEIGIAPQPATHPIATGDTIVTRTPTSLMAIDLATGKRRWLIQEEIAGINWDERSRLRYGQLNSADEQWMSLLDQRAWQDLTRGTISSDGKQVFSVGKNAARDVNTRPELEMASFAAINMLSAYDLVSGQRKWAVGGAADASEAKLTGASFLGPPLPIADNLYALCELQGEVRLVVLDATTGKLQWWQHLVQVRQDDDLDRGEAGLTPSLIGNVMVCPTAAGAVVAIDLEQRALLWGHRYQRANETQPTQGLFRAGRLMFRNDSREEKWADSTPVLSGNHVLITPRDSEELLCLDLRTGNLKWKASRGEGLYMAGLHENVAIVVGKRQVSAVQIADGKSAWSGVPAIFPSGASPSGRGFMSNGRYYIPLSSSQIATVDLSSGNLQLSSPLPSSLPLGNLICYRNQVISQDPQGIAAFHQLEPRKAEIADRLAKNPADAAALAGQAEIELLEGKVNDAIASLEQSLAILPALSTRQLLVRSYQQLLANDFSANAKLLESIEHLVDLPEEEIVTLKLAARGHRTAGRVQAALHALLQIYELAASSQQDEQFDRHWIRHDAWVQAELSELLKAIPAAELSEVDRQLRTKLDVILPHTHGDHAAQLAELERYVRFFGPHARADDAREAIVEHMSGQNTLLAREQHLLKLAASLDVPRRGRALARLAMLMVEANRPVEAANYLRRLSEEFADQVCWDSKTGPQLAAELSTDSPVGQELSSKASWPVGKVVLEQTTIPEGSPIGARQLVVLPMSGGASPTVENLQITFDQRGELIGRDGNGQQRWSASIDGWMSAPATLASDVRGHLVFATVGEDLFAIDTLRQGAGNKLVMWTKPLSVNLLASDRPRVYGSAIQGKEARTFWGERRLLPSELVNVGRLGPATEQGVCVRRGSRLLMLDPLSGETIWVRTDIPRGATVDGNDQALIVTTAESQQAMVLRTTDGELLATRTIPPSDMRWSIIGHELLAWEPDGRTMRLNMIDLVQDKVRVLGEFASDSKAVLRANKYAAVVEPGGKAVIYSLPKGEVILEAALAAEPQLESVYLLDDPVNFYLLTSGKQDRRAGVRQRSDHQFLAAETASISGRLYAYSADNGESIWPVPATIHDYRVVLDTPAEAPCLVFVKRTTGSRNERPVTGLLCVDKRNGHAAFRGDGPQNLAALELQSIPQENTLSMMMPISQDLWRLRFTDEPVPPQPPVQTDPEAEQGATAMRRSSKAGAILRALFGAANDLNSHGIDSRSIDEDD